MELFSFDAEYLQRLRDNDPATEAHFVSYFGTLMLIKLRRRVRSLDAIDDIRQEVFARVIGRLETIRNPQQLGSYVNSVANNVMQEYYRRETRYEPFPFPPESIPWDPSDLETDQYAQSDLVQSITRMPILHTFGTIITPAHRTLPSVDELLPQLKLPTRFQSDLLTAENLPLEMIRQVANNPRVMHQMSPRRFEEFIAELIEQLGFDDVLLTPLSRDGGRDIIARKAIHDIPITFFFECKKYAETNRVQLDTLRALLGVVAHDSRSANIGVLVTTSRFTRGCKELIATDCRLDGKDYEGIVGWVSEWARHPRRGDF
jgi:HJR/Mrr/RecB family endonuclease